MQRIIVASQSEEEPCLPRPVSSLNDWLKSLLELGVDGPLVQMINTPEETEIVLDYMRHNAEQRALLEQVLE